jgi:hypothetical protein
MHILVGTVQKVPVTPVRIEPWAGVKDSSTVVPSAKLAEHAEPHAMPAGELVTVPAPVPAKDTLRVSSNRGA